MYRYIQYIHILCCFYYYYLHIRIINSGANTNGNNLAESLDVRNNGAVFKNSVYVYRFAANILPRKFYYYSKLIKQEIFFFY